MTNTVQILVLQSTGFCNIDCKYCYLPDRDLKGAMPKHVLERVADEIVASPRWAPDSLVLWHAGEPTSLGIDWYREAHEILRAKSRSPLRVQFQTNGTLLDQAWIDFFKSSQVAVGLSLDGPREIHDKFRRTRSDQGTYDKVMTAVDLMQSNELPFSTISVVNSHSLQHPEAIYDFFAELRPQRVAFSIEEEEGANTTSSIYKDAMIAQTENFFYVMAKRNFLSSDPIRIREVEDVLAALVQPPGRNGKSQEIELGWIVTVGKNAEVAFFSPELLTTKQADGGYASVGNLMGEGFETLLANKRTRQLQASIMEGVAVCKQECEYFQHCGGGSPANKLFEHGRLNVSETRYCILAKKATARGVMRAVVETQAANKASAVLSVSAT